MKQKTDYSMNYLKTTNKGIVKRTIGILYISIIAIIGFALTGCAIVPTQGKGMAAGVEGEIVLDVDKADSQKDDLDKKDDVDDLDEAVDKVDEEPDIEDSGEDNKIEKNDIPSGEENGDKEPGDKEPGDSQQDDTSIHNEDNPPENLEQEDQVTSVYNSIVPPHMIPSSDDLKEKKIMYLTFDDGPSKTVTPEVLDILKEHDIKATFFMIGSLIEENGDIVERVVREGHTIANHSYSHNYKSLYASTNSFMDEIKKTDSALDEIVGDSYKPKYVRLPGGGFGTAYEEIKETLIQEGYQYITWNAVTNDAVEKNASPEKLFTNFKETLNGNNYSVALMHDAPGQKNTPQSLRLIIEYLKKEGYEFRAFSY